MLAVCVGSPIYTKPLPNDGDPSSAHAVYEKYIVYFHAGSQTSYYY